MGYAEYLAELLRPLGVYDLTEGTINRSELEGYGHCLDEGAEELAETEREMCLATAEGFGLAQVEEMLPYRPVCVSAEGRRAALAALLRIGGDSFTLEAVNDTISGCGIRARARETGTPNCVEVYFPDTVGEPEGFERIRQIIEEILPCQLGIAYVFRYLTWAEAGEKFADWAQVQAGGLTWAQVKVAVEAGE